MGTIRFSGYDWTVKASATKVGPGPNVFAADNVSVDARGLRLDIAPAESQWTCAEVMARGRFGYGTYAWTVATDLTGLDRSAVLGLFTWSDAPEHAHREIDVEFAALGVPGRRGTGLFTVQAGSPPNDFGFNPHRTNRSEHAFVWSPGRVTFSSSFGAFRVEWSFCGSGVPTPGGQVAPRVNLWLYRGESPGRPQRVTIPSFRYDASSC